MSHTVLLHSHVAHDVDVLSVTGAVGPSDAPALTDAVARAVDDHPRGVVLDLREVTELAPAAAGALTALVDGVPGWPRTSLCLCAGPDVRRALPDVVVHDSRSEALAHVDDRPPTTTVVPIEHSTRGPAQARRLVQQCAEALGLVEEGEDLVLVVSEIVTNAVRHARPPLELGIAADADGVLVAVVDGSPDRPQPREPGPDAEGGRGMPLVALLADEHGVRAQPPGKAVWAQVRRRT